jgi:hypothetical protein
LSVTSAPLNAKRSAVGQDGQAACAAIPLNASSPAIQVLFMFYLSKKVVSGVYG